MMSLLKKLDSRLRRELDYIFRGHKLVSGERFVPEYQDVMPWAKPHFLRYEFASELIDGGSDVLDVACGSGYGSAILHGKCSSYLGVDSNKGAISYAREHYPGDFECMDIFHVSKVADVVVSFETIEHIDKPMKVVLEFLASRANKMLIGSIPYKETRGKNRFHFHSELTEDDLGVLEKHGKLNIFYQEKEPGGEVLVEKSENTQNLVFVLSKGNRPTAV